MFAGSLNLSGKCRPLTRLVVNRETLQPPGPSEHVLISDPKGSSAADFQVAWISTRRGHDAADAISANLFHRYHLHSLMRSVTAPLAELSAADAVMLEVPPTAERRYEHTMLDFTNRILPQCANVTILVQPSLRRKSERPTWVQRWNFLKNTPFKFKQTCSCKLGNHTPNCHFTYLVGSTMDLGLAGCAEVATLSASQEALRLSLGGALSSIATCARLATRLCNPSPCRLASRSAGDEQARLLPLLSHASPDSLRRLAGRIRGSLNKHQTQLFAPPR